MVIFLVSLLLLAGGPLDYQAADKPLNGTALRGFRPVETHEVVLEKLGEEELLVFTGWNNRQTAIYARTRSPESEDWIEPVRISSPEARFDSLPSVWAGRDQAAHCVWQSKTRQELYKVLYSRRGPVSREWTAPVWIGEAGGLRRNPVSITGDSSGNLFIWTHNSPPGEMHPELQVFRSRDGGRTWERSRPFASLQAGVVSLFDPRLVVTGRGELHFLALRTQRVTTVLLTSSQDAGRSWTAPVALNETLSPRISDPRLWASDSLVQATWVDQPERSRGIRRLEAAFLTLSGEERKIQRQLVQEISHNRSLSYSVWDDGRQVGLTWMERRKKGPSAVRQRVTIQDARIHLGQTATIVESRPGFHFEELAVSHRPDLVLMTEKKVVTPPVLQACSKTGNESWQCEKIHTTSGSSDILAPLLVAEGSENLYRVIFHEVRFKVHIMQTVLDTTILTGTVTLKGGDGGTSDGEGNQGNASSSQFK